MIIGKLIFLTLLALINFYIFHYLIKKLYLNKSLELLIKYLFIFLAIGQSLYMFARHSDVIPQHYVYYLSYGMWISGTLLIVTFIYHIMEFYSKKMIYNKNRRDIFQKTLNFGAIFGGGFLLQKSFVQFKIPDIKNYKIKIDKIENFKIAQLTDLHIGNTVKQHYISQVVEKTNRENPDLIVITGDLIDYDIDIVANCVKILANLKAKFGVYFILGNHDYYYQPKKIIDFLSNIGIKTLENESIIIDNKFNLVGLNDNLDGWFQGYEIDIDKAFSNINKDLPIITLAHQPSVIEDLILKKQKSNLILSGHTHGGQMYPYAVLLYIGQPYIYGKHQHNKDMTIIVSSGIGFWGPATRLFTKSEIVIIDL